MNNWTGIGRLTKDPEVRYTSGSQMAVARFTVAVDRAFKKDGEPTADFIPIVVFGKQAESCERYLAKGRRVGIEGRIQTGSYEKQDGTKVYTTDVIASRVEFIDYGQKNSDSVNQSLPAGNVTEGIPEGFTAIDDSDIPF